MIGRRLLLAALLGWLVLLAIAFAAGAVRELVLVPLLRPAVAHVIGTLTVVLLFWVVILVFVRMNLRSGSRGAFWLVGLLWLLLTLAFEFLFFHYVSGKPWSELLADYNVLQGRIWVLVLLTTLIGPALAHWLLLRRSSPRA